MLPGNHTEFLDGFLQTEFLSFCQGHGSYYWQYMGAR